MEDIEIKNIQNVAQNMIMGSKQHALFQSVTYNPPLLSGSSEVPRYEQIEQPKQLTIDVMTVKNAGESTAISTKQTNGRSTQGNSVMPLNLNSHLYGILSPCSKQFGKI